MLDGIPDGSYSPTFLSSDKREHVGRRISGELNEQSGCDLEEPNLGKAANKKKVCAGEISGRTHITAGEAGRWLLG